MENLQMVLTINFLKTIDKSRFPTSESRKDISNLNILRASEVSFFILLEVNRSEW